MPTYAQKSRITSRICERHWAHRLRLWCIRIAFWRNQPQRRARGILPDSLGFHEQTRISRMAGPYAVEVRSPVMIIIIIIIELSMLLSRRHKNGSLRVEIDATSSRACMGKVHVDTEGHAQCPSFDGTNIFPLGFRQDLYSDGRPEMRLAWQRGVRVLSTSKVSTPTQVVRGLCTLLSPPAARSNRL